jgi:predicted transcriptional regulator
MIRKSQSELREEMRRAARGERRASPLPAAPLLAVLTPEAMELLGVLLREHPSSIRELVARTGRASSPGQVDRETLQYRIGLCRRQRADSLSRRPQALTLECAQNH